MANKRQVRQATAGSLRSRNELKKIEAVIPPSRMDAVSNCGRSPRNIGEANLDECPGTMKLPCKKSLSGENGHADSLRSRIKIELIVAHG
jgi:hypothetical protein